ncbi:tRNA (guanosine(37)-N1)-methyltransferase TrmD [Kiritimatiella glycovorans]|uniref:tRNA (guanine-N(1)-)-methyltransferase n=1 Tax=Kiritimatiella glycovorans TaxID=1307763 RepID=A0A0G3EAB9_9BACT|nr:tRNA (guanosine(37)-N1)-methyltransferase TrmD [Kiritimatiella glycovorans]AKJ63391.1 tRNA (guanine-N(1)-)-methyltransferase [Kiritimatiella glycovorans]
MNIDIITIFPDMVGAILGESIMKRAAESGQVNFRVVNLRDFTHDTHRTTDDRPYGGGPGMVMKPEPIFEAVESLRGDNTTVILTTPQGERFSQPAAGELTGHSHLVFICGHYEGVDERVREALVDREFSIGDYVLTNGVLPAAVIADAVVRLIPGVLGGEGATDEESFGEGLLEYPHYTRPPEFRGMKVPEVLSSGDHGRIARWRREQAEARTRERRPDLWERYDRLRRDGRE